MEENKRQEMPIFDILLEYATQARFQMEYGDPELGLSSIDAFDSLLNTVACEMQVSPDILRSEVNKKLDNPSRIEIIDNLQ